LVGKEGILQAYTLNGEPKWRADYGPESHISHPGARSIPTVYEGLVYIAICVGNLAGFDATSGKQVWSVKLFEQYDAPQIQWGYAESLFHDGDRRGRLLPRAGHSRVAATVPERPAESSHHPDLRKNQ
jgi:outer membrane protein assembly factor BamB